MDDRWWEFYNDWVDGEISRILEDGFKEVICDDFIFQEITLDTEG